MTQRSKKPQGPYDGIYGIPVELDDAPAPKPRPKARKPKRAPKKPPTERRKRRVGVLSWEGSVAAHLALVLGVLLWPRAPQQPPQPKVVPIEVSFVAMPTTPEQKTAPPGPPKQPEPKPVPKAPEKPHVVMHHAPATTVHHAVPRPPQPHAVRHGHPAQKAYHQLTQADLIAMARKRYDRSDQQDAQQLAALAKATKEGSHAKPQPAAGVAQGNPDTNTSGLSGALASRTPLRMVRPIYPARAERLGEEGTVRLRLWVSPAGTVTRVEVVRSSGWGDFDRAAIAAARQDLFTPLAGSGEQFGDQTFNFTMR